MSSEVEKGKTDKSSLEKQKLFPGETDEAHPEVFITIPPQPKTRKPGQLNDEQLKQYFDEGYVVIKNFFDIENELDPCREDIKFLVDNLAKNLHNAGKIKNLYEEEGLFTRLTKIEQEFPGANIILHKYGRLPPAFRALWSNERLLNIVEQLLNTEDIVGHPVWNLRTKTPKNEATTVPWHQDVGYLDNDAYWVLQPTAWIPLLDANTVNGCMQVVKGGHRTGRVCKHQCCHGGTWYTMIEEDEIERKLETNMKEDVVTCEVPYGGMLLINNLIPHRSLNNTSNDVRWSLDLRWQKASEPVGFYGLKKGVLLRSSKDKNLEIDWEGFNSVDRNKKQAEYLHKDTNYFDTSVPGPWMRKWEIVHVNHHVEALVKSDSLDTSWHAP